MGGETRREKSLRIGVHHADAVVWGPVYRTRLRRQLERDAQVLPVLRVRDRPNVEVQEARHDVAATVRLAVVRERARVRLLPRAAEPPGSLRAVPYERTSGWSSKASDGVQRRRGRGLKPRGARRDAPGKVLKDRRSPRERGRMGTGVRRTHLRRVHRVRQHRGDGAADAAPDDGRRQLVVLREGSVERVDIKGEARRQLESRNVAARRDRNQGVVV